MSRSTGKSNIIHSTIMLQKLFNPEWQITSRSFLLSSFLIGFSFSATAEISRLALEESLPRKTASIFKEEIGQESNGAVNQEKQIFLLCQISPSASSTRDLGTRLMQMTESTVKRALGYPRDSHVDYARFSIGF